MAEADAGTLSTLKYLSGGCQNICMLCFNIFDSGVYLDDSRHLQSPFYEKTITFEDMLRDLGATNDPLLPQTLCEHCADSAVNSFLFQKLCQQSFQKWEKATRNFEKAVDEMFELVIPTTKTAFLVVQKDNNFILSSHHDYKTKKNTQVLTKVRQLMKNRLNNQKTILPLGCKECGESFYSKSTLQKHRRTHCHEYLCSECPQVLPSKQKLNIHLERQHRLDNVQCPQCSKLFSSERILRLHSSDCHQPVKCQLCFTQLQSRKERRLHMKVHDTNKCSQCNRSFLSIQKLRIHMDVCSFKRLNKLQYICNICNRVYFTKLRVQTHLQTVHDLGLHDSSGKQLGLQEVLDNHYTTYIGEKPFPCDICGESFLTASHRMMHIRNKHFGPKLQCSLCLDKFHYEYDLRKHIERHKNPRSRLNAAENGKSKQHV